MSRVTVNQPGGTPAWVELAVPDLVRAKAFYRALFGWEYAEGPGYTTCLLRGLPVAALKQAPAISALLTTLTKFSHFAYPSRC